MRRGLWMASLYLPQESCTARSDPRTAGLHRDPECAIFLPRNMKSGIDSASKSFPEQMTPARMEAVARQFRVLGEASRLHLLASLMNGPATVGDLVDATGLKQGNVSKQLAALHEAGFLNRSRDGNFVRYEISDPVVFDLCELMCGRVGRTARERALALGA